MTRLPARMSASAMISCASLYFAIGIGVPTVGYFVWYQCRMPDVLTTVDPLGKTTTLAYDERNRLISKTLPDPDGGGALTAPVLEYEYDAVGTVVLEGTPGLDSLVHAYGGSKRGHSTL